ncbi:zinc finger protein 436 isoform X2 [Ixodes scapularis]|uniref:zinc finger protein 436 isoform X2 n=1 Tax=Ixodes scapularis TaxID=6945 RepID=UPI001A9EC14B|nr:zinc finger protein 436 isoform X2 [Ixodes scapularis]
MKNNTRYFVEAYFDTALPHLSEEEPNMRTSFSVWRVLCVANFIYTHPVQVAIKLPAEADCWDGESDYFSLLDKLEPPTQPRYQDAYQCQLCPYTSPFASNIVRHRRMHTGERPYRCSVCQRGFSQITNLRTHMRTHTGERPFRCEVCHKAFSQSTHLVVHKRVHTGEKPYQCRTCEKVFARRFHLLNHESTHRGDESHACEACGRTFTQRSHLEEHRKDAHK